MKIIFKILLNVFICTNTVGFLITFIPSRDGYSKICAKDLESPITYAKKHSNTRGGYIILTGVLSSYYTGVYVSLYLQEKPGRCEG
jgi:hypothetical protein